MFLANKVISDLDFSRCRFLLWIQFSMNSESFVWKPQRIPSLMALWQFSNRVRISCYKGWKWWSLFSAMLCTLKNYPECEIGHSDLLGYLSELLISFWGNFQVVFFGLLSIFLFFNKQFSEVFCKIGFRYYHQTGAVARGKCLLQCCGWKILT